MKFLLFVFLVVSIFWLLDLVVELMKDIVTKFSRLLQVFVMLAVLFFLLYTYIAFDGHVPINLKNEIVVVNYENLK